MRSEWKEKRLDELAIINRDNYSQADGWKYVNYLDTSSVTKGIFEKTAFLDLEKDKLPSRARRKVQANDIVYSTVRPIQEHYGLISDPVKNMLVSTGFVTLTPKQTVIPAYLYYYLSQSQVTIHLHSIAEQRVSTYPALSTADISELLVTIPPLPTQEAIAATLSCLDAKIELNNRINENLEQQAQAIFISWFVDFEPFQDGNFVESELGSIPEGWEVKRLAELSLLITKGTTPTTVGERFTESGVPYIKAESITNTHIIDDKKISFISAETHDKLLRSKIYTNDILITIAGSIGRYAYVTEAFDNSNTNQAIGILRVDHSLISPFFVFNYFLAGCQTIYLHENIQQAVQANLSLTSLRNLPVIVPDKQIHEEYQDLISPFFKMLFRNNLENMLLASLRDTLLPKLMSGGIEVPVE